MSNPLGGGQETLYVNPLFAQQYKDELAKGSGVFGQCEQSEFLDDSEFQESPCDGVDYARVSAFGPVVTSQGAGDSIPVLAFSQNVRSDEGSLSLQTQNIEVRNALAAMSSDRVRDKAFAGRVNPVTFSDDDMQNVVSQESSRGYLSIESSRHAGVVNQEASQSCWQKVMSCFCCAQDGAQ